MGITGISEPSQKGPWKFPCFFFNPAIHREPKLGKSVRFSYNTFISACDKALRWRHAIHAFSKGLLVNGRNSKEKTVRGIVTFNTTSSACSKSQQWQWATHLGSQAWDGESVVSLVGLVSPEIQHGT